MRYSGMQPADILLRKIRQHSVLDPADESVVRRLTNHIRELVPGEDFIRQGDRPTESAIVLTGMIGRYHTLRSGQRQYLSLHIAGDWPDAQGLFLERMDHSVCAIGSATLCSIPHRELIKAFRDRPRVGFAVWRETLIDAAIFRAAITNNSSRTGEARIAHLFAEIYFRSKNAGLVRDHACALPLTQPQIGEMLGMASVSVNRQLQAVRKSSACDWRGGVLTVTDWRKLVAIGGFDPLYLHQAVQPKR